MSSAPRADESSVHTNSSGRTIPEGQDRKRTRESTQKACVECRAKKTKGPGEKIKCKRCVVRGLPCRSISRSDQNIQDDLSNHTASDGAALVDPPSTPHKHTPSINVDLVSRLLILTPQNLRVLLRKTFAAQLVNDWGGHFNSALDTMVEENSAMFDGCSCAKRCATSAESLDAEIQKMSMASIHKTLKYTKTVLASLRDMQRCQKCAHAANAALLRIIVCQMLNSTHESALSALGEKYKLVLRQDYDPPAETSSIEPEQRIEDRPSESASERQGADNAERTPVSDFTVDILLWPLKGFIRSLWERYEWHAWPKHCMLLNTVEGILDDQLRRLHRNAAATSYSST